MTGTESLKWYILLAVCWSVSFFAPNSSMFWTRLAEKQQEEEHRQLHTNAIH